VNSAKVNAEVNAVKVNTKVNTLFTFAKGPWSKVWTGIQASFQKSER
jgi:hypothetical protein